MTDEEYIRNRLDMINRNSVYGLMTDSEITKIVRSHIKRDIGCDYDRLNCPKPPIYIGPVKVKSLKEKIDNYKRRKKEMKATSVQNIKNVNDICFSIENYPAEMESKLTIVASTNDDIFAFEFEGPDLLRSCKTAGLFTGWEKDQKIRELEKELSRWKKEAADCLKLRDKAVEEAKEFKKQLNQEKAANNAYHRFFKKYAGEGTELELTYISGSRNNADVETEYMIIDKEEYKKEEQERMELRKNFIKEVERCTKLRSEIIELEKLKTPTLENFANEEPSSRSDILDLAKKCVCGKREQDYGTPESNFKIIADLWNDYLGLAENGDGVPIFSIKNITPMDVAMMMSLLKIARIRNGGGSGDSFVDLAGYAACGGEIWHSNKETNGDSSQETDTV